MQNVKPTPDNLLRLVKLSDNEAMIGESPPPIPSPWQGEGQGGGRALAVVTPFRENQ